MKKIKNLLIIGLVILLMLCMSISLAGCKSPKTKSNIAYYGIIHIQEGSDNIYVYIPEIGYCLFPEYRDDVNKLVTKHGYLYEEPLKNGDVVRLNFGKVNNVDFLEEIQFDEITSIYYTVFSKPIESVYLYKENVGLEKCEEKWILSLDYDDFIGAGWVDNNCSIGNVVYIMVARFLTGEGTGSRECGSAQIEEIYNETVSLSLDLDCTINYFLTYFATGAIAFSSTPMYPNQNS